MKESKNVYTHKARKGYPKTMKRVPAKKNDKNDK